MYQKLIFVYLAFVLATMAVIEAKGGGRGGGGRGGGGRSSGRGSSGRRGSTSSIGSSSSSGGGGHLGGGGYHGGSFTSSRSSGGWFHGFFHSTPYRYTYRPTYISSSHPRTNPYVEEKDKEEGTMNKDNANIAAGYSISRALNGDFFSIFNVVHDIGKYPEKIKNREFLPSSTTEGPVSTYNLNDLVTPTYFTLSTTQSTQPQEQNLYPVDNIYDFNAMTFNKDNLEKHVNEILFGTGLNIEVSTQKSKEESTAYFEDDLEKRVNEILFGTGLNIEVSTEKSKEESMTYKADDMEKRVNEILFGTGLNTGVSAQKSNEESSSPTSIDTNFDRILS